MAKLINAINLISRMYYIRVMLISSLLTACTYNSSLPREWGNITNKGNECPTISGRYSNIGEESPDNPPRDTYDKIQLSELLLPGIESELIEINHVEINQENGNNIVLSAWDNSSLIYKKSIERRVQFECTGKYIIISESSMESPEGGIYYSNAKIYLAKNTEGFLVVNEYIKNRGLALLVIPYASNKSYWYRFSEYK